MKQTKLMNTILISCFLIPLLPFSFAFADDGNRKDDKEWYMKIFDNDDESETIQWQ